MKFACLFVVLIVAMASTSLTEARSCICPAVYSPVCATNGKTYSNSCEMMCAGASLAYEGACGSQY